MLSVTRQMGSDTIVLTPTGIMDERAVDAILQAISLTPEQVSILIDLSGAEKIAEHSLRRLAYELAQRAGAVTFRGSTWASDTPQAR